MPNLYPVYSYFSTEYLSPHLAYLKLARPGDKTVKKTPSFLFESTRNSEQVDRFSFMGVNPRKIIVTGPLAGKEVDPLTVLEQELKDIRQADLPGVPKLSGGAIGYISYDCIKYFEPTTKRPLKDVLKLPEAALMLFDEIVAFDDVFQRFQAIYNVQVGPSDSKDVLKERYALAEKELRRIESVLIDHKSPIPYPPQPPIKEGNTFTSNIGEEGYEHFVKELRAHIIKGLSLIHISEPTRH